MYATSSLIAVTAVEVMIGSSLMLLTAIVKVSETVTPLLSVAVTFTEMAPTSSFFGVPLNVRVSALNVSQEGNPPPFASVAV